MRHRGEVVRTGGTSSASAILLLLIALWPVAACRPTEPASDRWSGRWSGMTIAPAPSSDVVETAVAPVVVTLQKGVRAWVDGGRVEVAGRVALDEGWLEVAVCRSGSREHEAVVVVDVAPSVVHAALLLAGFEPGTPARWQRASGWRPATGDPIELSLRFDDGGRVREVPLRAAIRDERGERTPELVFAGSLVEARDRGSSASSRYLADMSGTIVGLSTFGDEVVAAREIRSPDESVDPATWTIRPGVLPPSETEIVVVLRRPVRGDATQSPIGSPSGS